MEPSPPEGYIVSLSRLHERGFGVTTGQFIWAMCFHYKIDLHNFSPNSISQEAVFVVICKGFLGIAPQWDLWMHLFRAKLHNESLGKGVHWLVRAGGLMLQVHKTCTSPAPW